VLVAHLTESACRTGCAPAAHRRSPAGAEQPLLAPQEKAALLSGIRADVTIDRQTSEHPRERLTVAG
jgi:hypothetical protein